MSHVRRTTFALFVFLLITPERISKPNSCAFHNFLMVDDVLIIFGIYIDKDQ